MPFVLILASNKNIKYLQEKENFLSSTDFIWERTKRNELYKRNFKKLE